MIHFYWSLLILSLYCPSRSLLLAHLPDIQLCFHRRAESSGGCEFGQFLVDDILVLRQANGRGQDQAARTAQEANDDTAIEQLRGLCFYCWN